ncbi:MAG: hypothetical protein II047_03950 [Bacteroidales bacterium]|nr:hypothetical protein [Bacteroidales bacterium]
MATTVVAPAANSIAYAQKYLPLLDEAYKADSKTAILDTLSDYVQFTGANTVNIFNLNPVGMANYDRNAGFVPGDVTGTWQPYVLETDRGRSYQVDFLDNDQAMGLVVPNLLATVERQHIIPEVDAYRFAQYAGGAASAQVITETLSSGAATVASIDLATATLDDAEVPYEGRILFVNPTTYRFLKGGITRMVMNRDRDVDYNVEMYNDMRVITVPSGRFQTAITLNAPTTSSGAGGFSPASGASAINYMIVHPSAILQVMAHYAPRIFNPNQNIEADAWRVQPRFAHGAWVKAHKGNGIYVSHA